MRAPVHAGTDGTPKTPVGLTCDATLYGIGFARPACPILALLVSVRSAESSGITVMPHNPKISRSESVATLRWTTVEILVPTRRPNSRCSTNSAKHRRLLPLHERTL